MTTRRHLLRGAVGTAALATVGAAGTGTGTGTAQAAQAAPLTPTVGTAGTASTALDIGILLYDGYSLLDPTGPAEILSRLPGATVTMIAQRRGPVLTDTRDVAVMADRCIADIDHLDVLLVPGAGNRGTVAAMENQELLRWIRRIDRHSQWTTSVCTGSLVLAAAGLLDGRQATTYWASADYLRTHYDVTYLPERYVRSGKIITAAGVSAGLDMALYLASLIAGDSTAKAIQLAVEYDPHPPFDAGNAAKADPELKQQALRLLAESQEVTPKR
ncbi:DJ-1/PfpI family protein [Streptomyces telluris]|uniref:DJ-1/PfpI family protein n=1 Tax=Streptomyces telluris TaxID=2720021 RepID=A0A9X2LLM6_9ACTN|nr:DJ-1/PfpI family protein [Streptomyces telluris]MCQ8773599.1 DJ-1/PfpI family protein [Streptomyces telluris]